MRALRFELMAMVLLLGGCQCSDGVCVPTGAPPAPVMLTTAGQPITVSPLLPTECGSRVPSSVESSVLDPSSSPIEATTGDPRITGSGLQVDITFTPTRAGRYHVVARFQPNFGVAQLDVIVAADMRDAGNILISNPCPRGDFTPGGLALCYRSGGAEVLAPAQRFDGLVARAEGTLWVSDGGTVSRWVEDGGAFELTATQTGLAHIAIVPAVDDALFLMQTGSMLRWFDGGIFPVSGPAASSNNVLWRKGNDVVTVKPGVLGWCVSTFDAGGRPCVALPPETVVMGFEPEGIWAERAIAGTSGGTAFEAVLFDNVSPAAFTMPEGWHLGPRSGTIPFDTGVVMGFDGGPPDAGPFVLRRVNGATLLEDYGPDVRSVTSTCVTTGTRLIRR